MKNIFLSNAFDRPTKATYPDGTTVETTWDRLDIAMAKYQHDAAGNRVSDGRHRYAWDAENRLVKRKNR